ncbi:MAG TPA: isochorismate synthase [Acidimicrobiales bacterium]|nr:isochorismate synthase [Acidimicrobiales bacterium]
MSLVDTVAAAGLVARTHPLDLPPGARPDLIAAAGANGHLWIADGYGLAGRGVALRLPLPGGLAGSDAVAAAGEALASVGHTGPDPVTDAGRSPGPEPRGPRPGPVALGALPFDRAAPAELVLPRALVTWDGRRAWLTTIDGGGGGSDADGTDAERLGAEAASAALGPPADRGPRAPDGFDLRSARPHDEWCRVVADTVERIREGAFGKVVLARRVDVVANGPLPTGQILERLAALYPACMVFRVGGFLGASPELLVRRRGDTVASHPLAGTVARSGDASADRSLVEGLLASAKDRAEHAFVIDDLRARLQPWCAELRVPERPSVLELRNVSHLETRLTGRLRPDRPRPSALQLAAAVHPTPAVAGTPTEAACAHIRAVEGFDRGPYAGPVGWMDAAGDGDWAIGIRSAVVDGPRASLFAGVGLIADSDPAAELAETQLKLQALLAAVVRP